MAQFGTLGTLKDCRNTKGNSTIKSRGWAFTLNNYMESEIRNIVDGSGYEYVFQEETGKNGTPHLQGGLYYKNGVSFNSVKKLLPRAHIEKMKNWHATKNYCSKGETRTGSIYTNIKDFVDKWHSGTLKKSKKFEPTEEWIREKIKEDIEYHLSCENKNFDFSPDVK